MQLQMPIPPSANHIFRSTRRGQVYRSRKYLEWHDDATMMVLATKTGKKVKPPYKITMLIIGGQGFRKDRDLDNCLKPVLDLLQHMDLIAEDNIQHLTELQVVYQTGDGRPAECHITIDPAKGG